MFKMKMTVEKIFRSVLWLIKTCILYFNLPSRYLTDSFLSFFKQTVRLCAKDTLFETFNIFSSLQPVEGWVFVPGAQIGYMHKCKAKRLQMTHLMFSTFSVKHIIKLTHGIIFI